MAKKREEHKTRTKREMKNTIEERKETEERKGRKGNTKSG